MGHSDDSGCAVGYESNRETRANTKLFGRSIGSEKFHRILVEMGKLHDKKQSDYGQPDDPFANVRASAEWGMPGWVGCMVRANDKIRRLQTMAKTGVLANESARDSFMDLAVYSIIGLCLFEDEQEKLGKNS